MVTLGRRMSDHEQACEEAAASQDDLRKRLSDAITRALESGLPRDWPERRYRVEGSAAGNSRLCTEADAEALQKRAGGQIIKLAPGRIEHLMSAEVLATYPDCPTCGVGRGEICQTAMKRDRMPHAAREKLREAHVVAKDAPSCRTCEASPGAPCVTARGGRPRVELHVPRVALREWLLEAAKLGPCAKCGAPRGVPCHPAAMTADEARVAGEAAYRAAHAGRR